MSFAETMPAALPARESSLPFKLAIAFALAALADWLFYGQIIGISAVIFGIALSLVSVLGDLGESLLKRDLGIKDISNLLPGHGGLMDRLDSILFAVPVAYALLTVLSPPTG